MTSQSDEHAAVRITRRISKARLLLAFAFAPPLPPMLYYYAMVFGSGYTQQGPGHIEKLNGVAVGFLVLSFSVSLICGGIILLTLLAVGKLTGFYVQLLAALVGFVAGIGFEFLVSWPNMVEIVKVGWAFGLIGLVCALMISTVFCGIAGLPWRTAVSFIR